MEKREVTEETQLDGNIHPTPINNNNVAVGVETGQQTQRKKAKKQRITVQISKHVIERIKNAVYWTPGLTLASLAEDAFSQAVDQLEKERKALFPKRKSELKSGRPIQ